MENCRPNSSFLNLPIFQNVIIRFLAAFLHFIFGQIFRIFSAFSTIYFHKFLSANSSCSFMPCPDIWLDVGDFLNLRERFQLMLVNRQICVVLDKGMQKFWWTEEKAPNGVYNIDAFEQIAAGNLCFNSRNLLIYHLNVAELLGRQNLFLRTRIRVVENIWAGELGRGDAIIMGTEYKALGPNANKEEEINAFVVRRQTFSKYFCTIWGKLMGNRNCKKIDEAEVQDNIRLRQFVRCLLVKSGKLMWAQTVQTRQLGYTLVFKCRIKKEDQRWKADKDMLAFRDAGKVDDKNLYINHGNVAHLFEDIFTYEIVRPPDSCWPTNDQTYDNALFRPNFTLRGKFCDAFTISFANDLELFQAFFFYHPICKLEVDENDFNLYIDCSVINYYSEPICMHPNKLPKQMCIYQNELGLNFIASGKIHSFSDRKWQNFADAEKIFWHRLIKFPDWVNKNSVLWKWKEYRRSNRYLHIKATRN